MQKQIQYKNVKVVYSDSGKGPCIVLLHGYLETGKIWDNFIKRFPEGYRLITLDLPGHGASGTWGKIHSMDDLSGSVRAVLLEEGIGKAFMVGHSMGGYVGMAFAELYPENLLGYSLLHSTCFADNEEKRGNREREISLVLCKKIRQIINVNIPKAFADENADRLKMEVDRAKRIALDNSDMGIVAILHGMKDRPDRTHILQNPELPLLLIGGMIDNYIPVEVFEKLITIAPHASVLRLTRSGHMGFIEEPELVIRAIVGMM